MVAMSPPRIDHLLLPIPDDLASRADKSADHNEDCAAFLGAPDLNALLTRKVTAETLSKAGFPISPKTLASMVTRGGGPPYRLFGARPLYRWGCALAWARGRLTEPRTHSSESDTR
jgi:hypothetical protein